MTTLKKTVLYSLLFSFGALLVAESSVCVEAARGALSLCLETLLPTLFPFFVLSSLVVASGGKELGAVFERFMHTLFSLGGGGASALALGLLGGYPVGARTVGELYRRGEVTREEAQQLLSFCNNSGPGFILGVCGAGIFQSARAGVYLYLVHAASALLTGVLLRRRVPIASCRRAQSAPPRPFFAAFPAAVASSFASIWSVCGFVILFMVLLRLISLFPPLAALSAAPRALFFGLIEMTNGVTAAPPTREGFVVCAAILGWGGMSVHAQALSVLDGTGLSLRRYFLGKALQCILSVPLALLAAKRIF